MSRRVVITGIGVISPLGIGVQTFWENLLAGQVALRRISAIDPSGFASQIGAEIPAYKIGDYVPKSYRKATKVMARDIELAVVAADNAFKDAGLVSRAYSDKPTIVSERFGCNIGAGLINAQINELTYALDAAREGDHVDHARWGREGINQLTPLWLLEISAQHAGLPRDHHSRTQRPHPTPSPVPRPPATWPSAKLSAPFSAARPTWRFAAARKPRPTTWG